MVSTDILRAQRNNVPVLVVMTNTGTQ